MLATFDLPAVRRFSAELKTRQRQCETSEGVACSTLDEVIKCHAGLCAELEFTIYTWARAIFKGRAVLDQAVESELKAQIRELLPHAQRVAAVGREKNWECFELADLNELHYRIASLDYLQAHWVSPQPSVAPAPRITLSGEAGRQIRERLAILPPLPPEWRPSDPEQIALYEKEMKE